MNAGTDGRTDPDSSGVAVLGRHSGGGPDSTRAGTGTTTTTGRLRALGRAEFTLLLRNRSALIAALTVPVSTVAALRATLRQEDLDRAGTTAAALAMTGGIGMALLMAVYCNLSAAYTARREDLVLKRLRTVEATDPEILAGTALPAVSLALGQIVALIAGGTAFLGLSAPQRPGLLILGVFTGLVLLTALAAATSAVTRTVESAQLTTLPLFLVSLLGSGLFLPLSVLPGPLASFCELLPVTGVMTLVRAGWVGGAGAYDLLGAALNALAWTVLAVFAVRRWFRWESRR